MAHDARCTSWTATDPRDCDCRTSSGKTTDFADQLLAARHAAETVWHQLTPCERADRYDAIAATRQEGTVS